MMREGSKIKSILSVAKDPKMDSRAVRALLTTIESRLMKFDGTYIDVYGPYPISMNVNGINIYTKTHVTNASD